MEDVAVIGAGLAGCEVAYRIAERKHKVKLIDCKPQFRSAAHHSEDFAELVCSNSLKSDLPDTAGGLLKAELRALGSLSLCVAERVRVPAGGALAVDRKLFAAEMTRIITGHPYIDVCCKTASDWNTDSLTVIATGPLTVGGLADTLKIRLGDSLGFYDASAPIVEASSIDRSKSFTASRYNKGEQDYINCPMSKEEYTTFVEALISAEQTAMHDFDKRELFESCMPIEIMARRGIDSVRFGPLRPVGFTDPATGKRPYAVVQLRAENADKTMYNLVGFQTNLKFGEQKRVFGLIPALRNAEFLRYGVMHRNTYVNAPKELDCFSRLKRFDKTFLAGQICGVEGYVESMASGIVCGINVTRVLENKAPVSFPDTTIIGALYRYITTATGDFQPMNANFGILPPLAEHIRDKTKRKSAFCSRSHAALQEFQKANDLI